MADDLTETIRSAAQSPAKAAGDEGSVESRPIADLIAADRHLASKEVQAGRARGFRLTKLRPPGTV